MEKAHFKGFVKNCPRVVFGGGGGGKKDRISGKGGYCLCVKVALGAWSLGLDRHQGDFGW